MHVTGVLISLFALGFSTAQAQSFGPLETLSGACWEAQIDMQDENAKPAKNVHCFERMFGGEFIRDSHKFVGEGTDMVLGESVYAPAGEGRYKITNYSELGSIEDTTAELTDEGALMYPVAKKIRSILQLRDENTYEVRQEEKKGGRWSVTSTLVYTRQP